MEYNLYTYKAEIVEVYDGDTVTAVVDLGFNVSQKLKVRLAGIDTPELRAEEREKGLIVRDIVRNMLIGEEVYIQTEKDRTGKYGRYLATIYLQDGTNFNQWLLDMEYAKPYGE